MIACYALSQVMRSYTSLQLNQLFVSCEENVLIDTLCCVVTFTVIHHQTMVSTIFAVHRKGRFAGTNIWCNCKRFGCC
jgi:hypothetical protein